MRVTIIAHTPDPVGVISIAAAACYGKSDRSERRVERCFENGHMSVFEHASVTFRIEGISRACSHQIVRHRLASYSQSSQRYVKGVPDSVVPPSILSRECAIEAFTEADYACMVAYEKLLSLGIPAEDARYILPNASETTLVSTMNLRELFHFLDLRTDKHAQWEIRDTAWAMVEECRKNEEISPLMSLWIRKHDIIQSCD